MSASPALWLGGTATEPKDCVHSHCQPASGWRVHAPVATCIPPYVHNRSLSHQNGTAQAVPAAHPESVHTPSAPSDGPPRGARTRMKTDLMHATEDWELRPSRWPCGDLMLDRFVRAPIARAAPTELRWCGCRHVWPACRIAPGGQRLHHRRSVRCRSHQPARMASRPCLRTMAWPWAALGRTSADRSKPVSPKNRKASLAG